MLKRITSEEYDAHFEPYVSMTKGASVTELIANHSAYLLDFVERMDHSRADYRYAPGKWTVKESLQHIIDMERVFAYRALSIGRGAKMDLPGVDQDLFASFQRSERRAFSDIQEEFAAMRIDHNILFRSLDEEALMTKGLVSGNLSTCRSWIFVAFGHTLFHVQLFKDRYGL